VVYSGDEDIRVILELGFSSLYGADFVIKEVGVLFLQIETHQVKNILGRAFFRIEHCLADVTHGEIDYYPGVQGHDDKDHQDEFGLQGAEHTGLTAWGLSVQMRL
jgi:hypothetical protein